MTPGSTELSPTVHADILARTSVLHAVRLHSQRLVRLAPTSLRAEKASVDLRLAAMSVPRPRSAREAQDDVAVRWLADDWSSSLQAAAGYRQQLGDGRDAEAVALLRDLDRALLGCPTGDVIASCFEEICELGAYVYGAAAWETPLLRVRTTNRRPGGAGDPYCMDGQTTRARSGPATITLTLHLDGFGPESYAALPRLLAHECLCHAVGGHPRRYAHNESFFAEGWLDWAVGEIFPHWAARWDRDFATTTVHHGEALIQHLMHRRSGWAHGLGHDYANNIATWLGSELGDDRAGRVAATCLAFALNRAPGHLRVKDAVTIRLATQHSRRLVDTTLAWQRGRAHAEDVTAAALAT